MLDSLFSAQGVLPGINWADMTAIGAIAILIVLVLRFVNKQAANAAEMSQKVVDRSMEIADENRAALMEITERAVTGLEGARVAMETIAEESAATREAFEGVTRVVRSANEETKARRAESRTHMAKLSLEIAAIRADLKGQD